MRYTTILLDADGTLFDYDLAEAVALEQTSARCGLDFSRDRHQAYRRINAAKWSQFERGDITKSDLQITRFSEWLTEIGAGEVDAEEFNSMYLVSLADGAQLIDGALEVCRGLSESKTLAIITNGVEKTQVGRLNKSLIKPFISAVFISERIGYSKPAPEYFDYVFSELGLTDKRSVLVVGDSLTSDIQGGKNYGIDTCWYNPQATVNSSGAVPTFEIRHLRELMDV